MKCPRPKGRGYRICDGICRGSVAASFSLRAFFLGGVTQPEGCAYRICEESVLYFGGEGEKLFFFVRVYPDHTDPDQTDKDPRGPAVADIHLPAELSHGDPLVLLEMPEQAAFILADGDLPGGCVGILIFEDFYHFTACHDGLVVHPDIYAGCLPVRPVVLAQEIVGFGAALIDPAHDDIASVEGDDRDAGTNDRVAVLVPGDLDQLDLRFFAFDPDDRPVVVDAEEDGSSLRVGERDDRSGYFLRGGDAAFEFDPKALPLLDQQVDVVKVHGPSALSSLTVKISLKDQGRGHLVDPSLHPALHLTHVHIQ